MPTLAHEIYGDGPTLVLLHGFPLDRRVWYAMIPVLSQSMRVVAVDLRGFGLSRTFEPFSIDTQADEVRHLLAELDIFPVVMAGLSMGGYVALSYAKRHTADLAGLVLIDTRAEADDFNGKRARNQMIELVQAKGPSAIAEQMFPKMLWSKAPSRDPELVDRLMAMMENCSAASIEHALIAMRDREDQTDFLPTIEIPTLIIVGNGDQITPYEMAKAMHDKIPHSQLVEIPGAGHLTPMEKPDAVTSSIVDFVSRLCEEPPADAQ